MIFIAVSYGFFFFFEGNLVAGQKSVKKVGRNEDNANGHAVKTIQVALT